MMLLIGDVQGCASALQRLLDEAGWSPSRDQLVLLGDLVNRGPDSLQVLRWMQAWGASARCVLGNHDLHLLAVAHGVRRPGRRDTLDAILRADDRDELLTWLSQQPLALIAEGWLCIHAGLPPAWNRDDALGRAQEVETVLRGDGLSDFLHGMYGDEPHTWDAALSGQSRLRFITNALTRMRLCDAQGRMDFDVKEGAHAAPPGFMPWFDVPGRASAGQPIAFGHWSTLGPQMRDDLAALDGGCIWGGCLSALRVDGGRRERLDIHCEAEQTPGDD
jgi:bis(5'-nucleosyl)-tetraphosphatase (symmetrical)